MLDLEAFAVLGSQGRLLAISDVSGLVQDIVCCLSTLLREIPVIHGLEDVLTARVTGISAVEGADLVV